MFFFPSVRRSLRLCALCLGGCLVASGVRAQDRLVFADKHVQDCKVIGMSGNSVLVSMTATGDSTGKMGFDLRLISRVDAAPPATFSAGLAAYDAGEWDKALAIFKPITEQFPGLPTDWARQAFALLGDIYIEKNDVIHAESAYNELRRLYPGGSSLRFDLGQARIALARADRAAARQQIDAIVAAALKNPAEVSRVDGAVYGKAFLLRGELQEKDGKAADALQDYLRTTTLFYQDAATAARAQARADALRAAHRDLAAP